MKCPKCGSKNIDKAKFCYECATPLSTSVETVIEENINSDIQLEELKSALKDKYEIIRELGRGGMGIVYECRELSLDRTVALKVLPRELSYDKQFVERFKKEIKILAKIEHPNIVQLISADEVNGFIYFTMKYVKGRNLADFIKEKVELDQKTSMNIALQIVQALSFAHESNVLHRDLKPENVMIDDRGHVYIMDFGIARVLDGTRMTRTGSAIGTPEYMSPEQCSGESEPDGRSDIYSLGVLMFEMLTGFVPFKGEATAVMYQHVNIEPAPLAKMAKMVTVGTVNLVNSCLEKKPEKRPQSAADLISLLNGVIEIRKNNKRSWFSRKDKMIPKPEGKSRLKKIILRTFKIAITIVVLFILHIAILEQNFMVDIIPTFYLKFLDGHQFANYYNNRCSNKLEADDYKGAMADCTRALDLGFKSSSYTGEPDERKGVYRKLAWAKKAEGDYDGAIYELTRAITLNPSDSELYSDRARVKGDKGDFDSGSIDFDLALKIDPKDSRIYRKRGQNKSLQNNFVGAISDATMAINIATDKIKKELSYKPGYYSSGYYMDPIFQFYGEYIDKSLYDSIKGSMNNNKFEFLKDDSFINLEAAIRKKLGYVVLNDFDTLSVNYNFRGYFKLQKGELSGTLADCTKAIDIDPEYSDAYFNRGMAKHGLGDLTGAISDYTRTIDIDPKNTTAYKQRGEAKKTKGDISGADKDFEKWKSLN